MKKPLEIKNQKQKDLYLKFISGMAGGEKGNEVQEILAKELEAKNVLNTFKYLFMLAPTIYDELDVKIMITDKDDYLTDMMIIDGEGKIITVKNTVLPPFDSFAGDTSLVKVGKKAVSLLARANIFTDDIGYIKANKLVFASLMEKVTDKTAQIMLCIYDKKVEKETLFEYKLDKK